MEPSINKQTHTFIYTYNIRQIIVRYGVLGWGSLSLGGLSYAKEKNVWTPVN